MNLSDNDIARIAHRLDRYWKDNPLWNPSREHDGNGCMFLISIVLLVIVAVSIIFHETHQDQLLRQLSKAHGLYVDERFNLSNPED